MQRKKYYHIKNQNSQIVRTEIDVLENEIIEKYPSILNILLSDRTTGKNIFWATDNYKDLGLDYSYSSNILPEMITGEFGNVIMPRVYKDKILQLSRSKEMAEVFTPSWICNAQNNSIDNSWFNAENIFNQEVVLEDGTKSWITNKNKITFPDNKTWIDYVADTRLEISCGEAPYIVSRYDTTTGAFISIENRIGLLDRKLRVVNENTTTEEEWIKYATLAFQNIYAFEWQGDSLLLAREALLISFIEYFNYKFTRDPSLETLESISDIISWNVWQMDGMKGVVPNSCIDKVEEVSDLFGLSQNEIVKCKGCNNQNILLHNGIYSIIKDWGEFDESSGEYGVNIKFIDLIK